MSEATLDAESRLFAALSDASRRTILCLLGDAPRRAGELAAAFPDLTRPAISKHLRVLRESGWVEEERRGRQRIYSLRREALGRARRWLQALEPASRQAGDERSGADWAPWSRRR